MLKGFKEFILRGNVVELATAVIIGAAFTAIVTAFTDKVIQPLINSIGGNDPNAVKGLGFCVGDCRLPEGSKNTTEALNYVDLTAVITAAINFLIVAAVVYFIIVLPYNKLSAMMSSGDKDEDTEVSLLTQIRNLLDPEAEKEPEPVDYRPRAGDIPPPPAAPAIRPAGGYPTGSQPPVPGPGPAGTTPPPAYPRGGWPTGSQPPVPGPGTPSAGGYPSGSP
ncbi:large conductance mechanosensitive channel protein MscL, partial [Gordonia sp. (in: high G+C Gram-positive bacteria)]|uniref:large conductance mechanosensitive channel protein MscL n=1 Tax=Gordonia sp. (in: high G+C Gram-positive bacteria) TaxID=84139 RepID=UPI0039E2996C